MTPLALAIMLASRRELPKATEAALLLMSLAGGSKRDHEDLGLMVLFAGLASGQTESMVKDWTPEEMAAFRVELGGLGVPLRELLLMLAAESDLDPAATSGSAWGINQAQEALLFDSGFKGSGWDYSRLPLVEQLPHVRRMLMTQFRWIGYVPSTAAELFRMNLSPRAARARSSVIYDSAKDPKFYDANRGLDRPHDGVIDMADLQRHLDLVAQRRRFRRHLALLEEASE